MIIQGKEYRFRLHGETYHCALDVTMAYIGGKWKSVILWYLRKETRRFGELRRQIPDITEKMLSLQLRQLEQDGLVKRTVHQVVPPKVEYALTPRGRSLVPVLDSMAGWGRAFAEREGTKEEVLRQPRQPRRSATR